MFRLWRGFKNKNYFSYKLGLILIKAHKNWYKGGYIKFWFDLYKLKKNIKIKRQIMAIEFNIQESKILKGVYIITPNKFRDLRGEIGQLLQARL